MAEYGTSTALLVVDVQHDFADPAGSLFVAGADRVVRAANAEIGRATAAGALVVYTQDWHPEHTPHFRTDGGTWPVHCVAGTWGAELHPDLDIAPGCEVVRKGTGGEDGYSAFSVRSPTTGEVAPTGLAELLGRRQVEAVVVVGLATDYCVRETALDARSLGLAVTVVDRAVAAVDLVAGDGRRALEDMATAGVAVE